MRSNPNPVGRWFGDHLDLKTLLLLGGIAASAIANHYTLSYRVATLESRDTDLTKETIQNTDAIHSINHRITEETVSRVTYEHDTVQLNQTLANLNNGQQQIYNLLVQRGSIPPNFR